MKILALLLLSAVALAENPVYIDAALKDFHVEQHGSRCTTSGNSDGAILVNTDPQGHTSGTIDTSSSASTRCAPNMMTLYTVIAGEHVYVLTPRRLPFSNGLLASAFRKDSDLAGLFPGTPIKMRSEGSDIYVKVGKRESVFKMVSMQ